MKRKMQILAASAAVAIVAVSAVGYTAWRRAANNAANDPAAAKGLLAQAQSQSDQKSGSSLLERLAQVITPAQAQSTSPTAAPATTPTSTVATPAGTDQPGPAAQAVQPAAPGAPAGDSPIQVADSPTVTPGASTPAATPAPAAGPGAGPGPGPAAAPRAPGGPSFVPTATNAGPVSGRTPGRIVRVRSVASPEICR